MWGGGGSTGLFSLVLGIEAIRQMRNKLLSFSMPNVSGTIRITQHNCLMPHVSLAGQVSRDALITYTHKSIQGVDG